MNRPIFIRTGILFLCVLCGSAGIVREVWPAVSVNNNLYAYLLKQYVKNDRVDYEGFKKDEVKLDQYLNLLEKTDSKKLSRNEQFAFYINAYNAWIIKLVLSGYPGIKSIKDLGSFFQSPWKKKLCRIDGKTLTLDDIEHKILRPRFQDPRVHFAINCASKSCPPLLSDPYRGSILDQQLDSSTRVFINDLTRNNFDGETLHVSKIFKWFSGDFKDDVIVFFLKYADTSLKQALLSKRGEIIIEYLDYDWSLNGK